MLASTLFLRAVGPAIVLSHKCDISSLFKDDQICARQSLASTVSAPRVAATSYFDPGRHANLGKSNGGFSERRFSNNRFVLKPDVTIASEVSILSTNSLAITDFHAKKRSTFNYLKNPFLEPPHSRFHANVVTPCLLTPCLTVPNNCF